MLFLRLVLLTFLTPATFFLMAYPAADAAYQGKSEVAVPLGLLACWGMFIYSIGLVHLIPGGSPWSTDKTRKYTR